MLSVAFLGSYPESRGKCSEQEGYSIMMSSLASLCGGRQIKKDENLIVI